VFLMNMLCPIINNDFGKLVERVFNECRVPFRNSKYSNHVYSNFVHVYCLVYKERLNVSYRRFERIAKDLQLNRLLAVKSVPHFSTLQKFLQRMQKDLFRKLVRVCHKLLKLKNLQCSIDSTGISLTNPSAHYLKRVDSVKVKNFTKTSLNVENNHKIILDIQTHTERCHDTKDFIPLLKNLCSVSLVLADKAYDSTKNLKYVLEELKAEPQIPVRQWKQQRYKYGFKPLVHGKLRRKMLEEFDEKKYSKRNIVESINSALKRTLGSWVCSRKPKNQEKQVIIKALAYNLEIITVKGLLKIKALFLCFRTGILQSQRNNKTYCA